MLEIFQYDFMIRAFAAGLMIGVIAPLIGLFLVVRRYSLLADTLAHVSLAGVAVGIITKINPITTAIVVSVLTAIGIEKLKANRKSLPCWKTRKTFCLLKRLLLVLHKRTISLGSVKS